MHEFQVMRPNQSAMTYKIRLGDEPILAPSVSEIDKERLGNRLFYGVCLFEYNPTNEIFQSIIFDGLYRSVRGTHVSE